MKTPLFSLILPALAALSASAQNQPIEAEHRITAATVYPDRALVTRSATVQLHAGTHEIALGALPANLDANSVRARATGNDLTLGGVQVERDFVESNEPARLQELREAIKTLEESNQDLNDEKDDLNEKQNLLQNLSQKAGQPTQKDAPTIQVGEIEALVEYYGSELQKISRRLREIERTIRDNQEEINRLRGELNTLQGNRGPKTRKVVLTLEAKRPTTAQIEVDAVVYGASWTPQYDVHAEANSEEIELISYGIVHQNTGEEWMDIALTLSTARPQQGTSVPNLPTWTLDFPQPAPPVSRSASGLSLEESAVNSNRLRREVDELRQSAFAKDAKLQAKQITANVQQRGYSAVFQVPGTVDIPSDNNPHRNTISIQKMESEKSYVAIPKQNEAAFVKARVRNANPAPLLPGPINLFMEGDYLGQSQLSLVPPEGTFTLFLGQDDAIKVKRTENVTREETRGMLNKMRTMQMGFTITLENFRKNPVRIRVEDQIPVSKNEEIRVVTGNMSPKPDGHSKGSGTLSWQLDLAPNEKIEIKAAFEVTSPSDRPVIGL